MQYICLMYGQCMHHCTLRTHVFHLADWYLAVHHMPTLWLPHVTPQLYSLRVSSSQYKLLSFLIVSLRASEKSLTLECLTVEYNYTLSSALTTNSLTPLTNSCWSLLVSYTSFWYHKQAHFLYTTYNFFFYTRTRGLMRQPNPYTPTWSTCMLQGHG